VSTENTYRYLFPIGGLNAILGALLWIAFRYQWIEFYPISMHGNLMIGGFLLSFAFGFLWTAIPRFLRAPMPTRRELLALVAAMGATPVLGLLSQPAFFYLAVLSGLSLTIHFGVTRFRLRRNAPPPSFVFVFFGMLATAISLLVLIASSVAPVPVPLASFARAFFLKGFVLFLVLGIGMKLIPALTGWKPAPEAEPGNDDFRVKHSHGVFMALITLGLWLESQGQAALAGPAYALGLILAGISEMKLGSLPRVKSGLSLSVWASMIVTSLSPLLFIYNPSFALHFWHLIFIGGFGLLTVFVSLRVVMAHSGQEFLKWEKRPAYFVIAGLILLAALTRLSAAYIPGSLLNHYAYAAFTWIAAIAGWACFFVRFTPGILPHQRKGALK
jgi:uncharacterized protein involved in response to NO